VVLEPPVKLASIDQERIVLCVHVPLDLEEIRSSAVQEASVSTTVNVLWIELVMTTIVDLLVRTHADRMLSVRQGTMEPSVRVPLGSWVIL